MKTVNFLHTDPIFPLGCVEAIALIAITLWSCCALALAQIPRPRTTGNQSHGAEVTKADFAYMLKGIEDLAKLPTNSPLLKEAYISRGYVDHTPAPWQKIVDQDILQRADSADVFCSIVRNPDAVSYINTVCSWIKAHPEYSGGAAVRKEIATQLLQGSIPTDIPNISTLFAIAYMFEETGTREDVRILDWLLEKYPGNMAFTRSRTLMLKRLATHSPEMEGDATSSRRSNSKSVKLKEALPSADDTSKIPGWIWATVVISIAGLSWLVIKKRPPAKAS